MLEDHIESDYNLPLIDAADVIVVEDDEDCLVWLRTELFRRDIDYMTSYDREMSGDKLAEFCNVLGPSIVVTGLDWGEYGQEGLALLMGLDYECLVILLVDAGDKQAIEDVVSPDSGVRVFAKYDNEIFTAIEEALALCVTEAIC